LLKPVPAEGGRDALSGLFLDIHRGISMLAMLLALPWSLIVILAPERPIALGRLGRPAYKGAIVSMVLAGLTSFLLAAWRSWLPVAYAWIGLGAVFVYVVAGALAREALLAGRKSRAIKAAMIQVALLAFILVPAIARRSW
jgi:hypothetical protein